MNNAFRSHLMQQFAASARNQSRPPLVLASSNSSNNRNVSVSTLNNQHQHQHQRPVRSRRRIVNNNNHKQTTRPIKTSVAVDNITPCCSAAKASIRSNNTSQFRTSCVSNNDEELAEDDNGDSVRASAIAKASNSKKKTNKKAELLPRIPTMTADNENMKLSSSYIQISIQRSIQSAILHAHTASNNEPLLCSFKQIISESNKSRLIEIYHNFLLGKKQEQQHLNKNDNLKEAKIDAIKQSRKWDKIPSFLVVLMKDPNISNKANNNHSNDNNIIDEYKEISSPNTYLPKNAHELETYGKMHTIIHNIIFTLKYKYGIISNKVNNTLHPIIHTIAFRNLIGLDTNNNNNDLIVSLLMIGLSSNDDDNDIISNRQETKNIDIDHIFQCI